MSVSCSIPDPPLLSKHDDHDHHKDRQQHEKRNGLQQKAQQSVLRLARENHHKITNKHQKDRQQRYIHFGHGIHRHFNDSILFSIFVPLYHTRCFAL
jgi:hypothetical protein